MSKQQNALYAEAGANFAPAIARLAHAMERQPDQAAELVQEIHLELWRSFARFEGQCSLSTWVYRVAHNVAADHVGRQKRGMKTVPLDQFETLPAVHDTERGIAENHAMARVYHLLQRIPSIDAQVVLLWLEGQSGAEISAITGLGGSAVSVRIHRAKAMIAEGFHTHNEDM
ncbi:sigma-70 family RNA polymerase sigma factor [Altererythrobacter confluentis]|uniref:Sigma-70 family RNA polymerase sigma factor n=1 Tax=Allopontixanthobacter confluentis TaxID=1849021 RepID=A0A6L7GDQ5_9SPHN|nr:RNA polymerase sigma factor [Allopontixanthobacter confluentis]MXP14069.1 sigma-70 family RNA polymerase sigma factor [Allopontixanthobacter confluentis]